MGSTTEIKRRDARWKDYFDFTSACGRAHNPKDFAINIINNIIHNNNCYYTPNTAYHHTKKEKKIGSYIKGVLAQMLDTRTNVRCI